MRSNITIFNGHQVCIEFQPQSEAEQRMLNTLKSAGVGSPLDDDTHVNVEHWVETALAQRGYSNYVLLGYERFSAGQFVFTVGRHSR